MEKQKNVTPIQEKRVVNRKHILRCPRFGISKDFKAAIINMFKDVQENMISMSEDGDSQDTNGNYKKGLKWKF